MAPPSLLRYILHVDAASSSRHENDASFACGDFDAPPLSPATPQMHSPYSQSRSSSPSRLRHTAIIPTSMTRISPEQVTSSPPIPTNEPLSASEKPNSESRQPGQKLEPSTTFVPSQNIHQLSTRYFCPSLVLQNTGSVARDHLASERTFLAYVRTSLGLASAGVALVQLFTVSDLTSKSTGVPLPAVNQRVQKFMIPLGLSALGMALIVLLIGTCRYFLVQHALPENKFPATRLPIVFISFCLGAVTMVAFGALLSEKIQHD